MVFLLEANILVSNVCPLVGVPERRGDAPEVPEVEGTENISGMVS